MSYFENRSKLTGFLSRRNTASHRIFTRLRALPLSPPQMWFCFPPFPKDKKQENTFWASSCKKSLCMTSYDGIIRIRLKGRSSITSSQPVTTSSPLLPNYNIPPDFILQLLFSLFSNLMPSIIFLLRHYGFLTFREEE